MKKLLLLLAILVGGAAIVIYLLPDEYRKDPALLVAAIGKWLAENMPED
jgi:hypothetical protein